MIERAKRQDNRYLNPVPVTVGGPGVVLKVLPKMLFGRSGKDRVEAEPGKPLGPFVTDVSVYATAPASGLRVTWFGHSSSMIEIDGFGLLIDPIWEPRASPFRWMGPKRFFAPTLPLESLPQLDAVLISHDHYDHLGADTVRQLAQLQPAARWVTALGVGEHLRKFGVAAEKITELDWTLSTELVNAESGTLRVTAWPARHFSGRGLNDRFATLWSSFVLEGAQHRVYYGADSGYWDGFAELGQRFGAFNLTMLEIGASSPLWPDIHLGPDNAVSAYEAISGDALGGLLMPIHWGLFNLALHGWRQPMERLEVLAAERSLPVWSPLPGEPTDVVQGEPKVSSWWRNGNKAI